MIVIGIDVSKDKLDSLWLREIATGKVKSKVFKNDARGHAALIEWVGKNTGTPLSDCRFVMEATGIYHEALAYALYESGAQVCVVNPAQIHNYAKSFGTRSKTDKKDSRVIAHFGATQQPRLWQPEPAEIRTLKALLARHEAIERDIRREQNRLEKAQVSPVSEAVLASIHSVLEHLGREKKRIEDLIKGHIDQHPALKQDRVLLESIPGIGPVVSRYMMSVIRSRPFESAAQCAAFLGVIPIQHESGSSVRGKSRLSKAGSGVIRAKLYMAATVAIQHNPDIKRQYARLLRNGKSKMAALGAAMRKLVHICFGVLKHQKPYQAQSGSAACV